MPTTETLNRFIARVEQNAHVEAIEEFYAMQENQLAPRVGRDVLVAHERIVLSKAKSVFSQCVKPVFVSGDLVVIRWIFRLEWLDGSETKMEELAISAGRGNESRRKPSSMTRRRACRGGQVLSCALEPVLLVRRRCHHRHRISPSKV